jgi:hypothetical protein
MGLANLVIAEAALRTDPDADPETVKRVGVARAAAEKALVRDGTTFLISIGKDRPAWQGIVPQSDDFTYYQLWSLEKACVFAGMEQLSGIPWYATGAKALLGYQFDDGSWGYRDRDDAVTSTAFALLFLLRSSEAYHPTTPRPVEGRPTTTPRDRPPEPPVNVPAPLLPVDGPPAPAER